MNISQTIVDFATLAIKHGGWMEMDRIYLQNRILCLIGEDQLTEVKPSPIPPSSLELLDSLIQQAVANEVISGEIQAETDILEAQIMDLLTPPPSVLNALFAERYAKDVHSATEYFFELSKTTNYIKTRDIARNVAFTTDTKYGELQITINLSKPEKDPKQIALERTMPAGSYPKCQLCMENEGYAGRINYPARTNLRIVRMNLDGESWGFQYSPYAYFNEHCIFLAEEHRPMVISPATFRRLLKIVTIFPHYFVGSNADLPIVGGSILSHDHYQGGRHTFPMALAAKELDFQLAHFPQVSCATVNWPMSVIRLTGNDAEALTQAATYVLEKWRVYSDPAVDVIAFSEEGTPHHTITPIARRNGSDYELDLVLRDNHTSALYPDGVFHPHPEVHHIKKENIGLIEVMGLAVLPARLKAECKEVEAFLLDKPNQIAAYHLDWAETIKATKQITEQNVHALLEQEIGHVFAQVLEDVGVFKRDVAGQSAFKRFLTELERG